MPGSSSVGSGRASKDGAPRAPAARPAAERPGRRRSARSCRNWGASPAAWGREGAAGCEGSLWAPPPASRAQPRPPSPAAAGRLSGGRQAAAAAEAARPTAGAGPRTAASPADAAAPPSQLSATAGAGPGPAGACCGRGSAASLGAASAACAPAAADACSSATKARRPGQLDWAAGPAVNVRCGAAGNTDGASGAVHCTSATAVVAALTGTAAPGSTAVLEGGQAVAMGPCCRPARSSCWAGTAVEGAVAPLSSTGAPRSAAEALFAAGITPPDPSTSGSVAAAGGAAAAPGGRASLAAPTQLLPSAGVAA